MTTNRKHFPLHELIDDAYEAVHIRHTRNMNVTTEYLPGFIALNAITSEFEPGSLVVIASRPSMGKSILAMNIVQFLGGIKIPKVASAIFSLDIPKEQLVMRMLSATACISYGRMMTGHLDDSDLLKLNGAKESLRQSKIYIDDTPGIGLIELMTKVRRLITDHDVGVVIIDYLQLMRGESDMSASSQ